MLGSVRSLSRLGAINSREVTIHLPPARCPSANPSPASRLPCRSPAADSTGPSPSPGAASEPADSAHPRLLQARDRTNILLQGSNFKSSSRYWTWSASRMNMKVDHLNRPSGSSLVDGVVCPGDIVLDLTSMSNQTIKLGVGLRQECDTISVMKAGKLRFSKPNKYWVESSHKRYVPSVNEAVLGIVVDCKPDNFLVDIKGPFLAHLPVLAFEGGTRRNIPKFEIGTLLYVRVVKSGNCMNPEVSCTDDRGKAAEFGPLRGGYVFESSTGLSRMLLGSPTCPVLESLGKKLSFEIAVGLNGRIWVNASSPSTTILVSNAILNSEFLSEVQQRVMVEKLMQRLQ